MTSHEQVDDLLGPALTAYRMRADMQLTTAEQRLVLTCPHGIGRTRLDSEGCAANLLNRTECRGEVELGVLVDAALMHEDPDPSLDRTCRLGELDRRLGELAAYRVSAEHGGQLCLALTCPYRGGRCPGSQDGECLTNLITDGQTTTDLGTVLRLAISHENARYGVPVARLDALREKWEIRQQAETYRRRTADRPSASTASAKADVYGQVLADLAEVTREAQGRPHPKRRS